MSEFIESARSFTFPNTKWSHSAGLLQRRKVVGKSIWIDYHFHLINLLDSLVGNLHWTLNPLYTQHLCIAVCFHRANIGWLVFWLLLVNQCTDWIKDLDWTLEMIIFVSFMTTFNVSIIFWLAALSLPEIGQPICQIAGLPSKSTTRLFPF